MKKVAALTFNEGYVSSVSSAIACPLCGDFYMHQGAVEVFSREHEDAPSKSFVVGSTISHGSGDPNPSGRRNGLLIEFECEPCHMYEDSEYQGRPLKLAIYQHKGATFIEWHIDE